MSRAKVNLYYYKNEICFVYLSLCLFVIESHRFNQNFAQRRLRIYAVHSYIDLYAVKICLPFQSGSLLYSKATVLEETPKSHCRDFFIQLKIMNLPVYLSNNTQSHIKKNVKNFKLNADVHNYHLL